MRITFILPTATMGGGTKVVGIYAMELKRRGHNVCVISLPRAQLPLRRKISSWLKGKGWPAQLATAPSHLDGLDLDHRVLDTWRPVRDDDVGDGDVIVATWWETAEWVARLAPGKGAKAYFVQHHEVFDHLPARSRLTYRLPIHKVVVARWLKNVMANEYDDRSVDIVPNSVDHSQFFAPIRGKQKVPTVGFLYSHATFKGVDVTLAALAAVRERLPNLRVISFGSDLPREPLVLTKDVEFTLRPPQDRIRDIFACCDVWVTASRSEGFNLPAMEAMACRTPVVSTKAGWPEEAIQTGLNGVLVDVDDVAALARAIEWVVTRPSSDWKALSLNAFKTAEHSSWNASAALFEAALRNAVDRATRGEIAGGQ